MERELVATGIGGQGIQLAAQALAQAAVREGREVLLFGSYGGMMRGGNTDASLVFADGPIETPPVISSCWVAMAMHHAYLRPVLDKLRPDSVLFVNTSVVEEVPSPGCTVVEVPATELAVEVGGIMCASMVMVGAVSAATGLVSIDALAAVLEGALPSYRQQHRVLNERALRAGYDAGPEGIAPAWIGAIGARTGTEVAAP